MRRFPRLLLLLLLVVFAAGSVLSVATATAMALDMAAVDDTNKTMDGCAGYHPADRKQDGAKCDMDCTPTSATGLSDVAVLAVRPSAALLPGLETNLADCTRPPGLFPPRDASLG